MSVYCSLYVNDFSLCFKDLDGEDESHLLLRRPSWSFNKALLLIGCLLLLLCGVWLLSTIFWLHRPPSQHLRRPPPPAAATRPESPATAGLNHTAAPSLRDSCGLIPESWRFDCYPERGVIVTRELCEARNCCFIPASSSFPSPAPPPSGRNGLPWCFYPADFPSYTLVSINETSLDHKGTLVKEVRTYYPGDILTLEVDIRHETDTRLRVKVSQDSGLWCWTSCNSGGRADPLSACPGADHRPFGPAVRGPHLRSCRHHEGRKSRLLGRGVQAAVWSGGEEEVHGGRSVSLSRWRRSWSPP